MFYLRKLSIHSPKRFIKSNMSKLTYTTKIELSNEYYSDIVKGVINNDNPKNIKAYTFMYKRAMPTSVGFPDTYYKYFLVEDNAK